MFLTLAEIILYIFRKLPDSARAEHAFRQILAAVQTNKKMNQTIKVEFGVWLKNVIIP